MSMNDIEVEHRGSGFLANLDHEQRVRYYQWWRQYVFWKRACGILVIAFIALNVAALAWGQQNTFWEIVRDIRKKGFLLFIGLWVWGSMFDCPRCGESFRGWFSNRYLSGECQNCGLSEGQLSSIAKPQELDTRR